MKRMFAFFLALVMCLTVGVSAAAPASALADTAAYLQKTVPSPQVASVGGEWTVIGLARGGYAVPASYYQTVEATVRACGGVLHERKYTEYSRVILALNAIGKDPTKVAGFDLTKPLQDFEKTVWQGINGPIWALIALDSGGHASSLRQRYVDYILEKECAGGGWSLSGSADADITGMALQALAKYQNQAAVKAATDRALVWLSKTQNADGSFSTAGKENCESTVQVLVALCELGIPLTDSRFVKNEKTVMDGLMTYYVPGDGFTHVRQAGGGNDLMSTEQGFYALVAADRAAGGKSSLYCMDKAAFSDIASHPDRAAIETLADKGILNGMGDGTFAPNKTMTRAEYCTMVVKALELTPKANADYSDVPASAWYAPFVGTASDHGIVNGVGGGRFDPGGTITYWQAAVMIARAAKALGFETAADADAQPQGNILRCEIARMLYEMLKEAGKL
ncbi:MAG: S-layer homology domain-containing protein [Oscillospiraceae bacterium]|nr:S-layer homology domain-containing protein [Oscillospiraceae bacterium]